MPKFIYTAKESPTEVKEGLIEAENQEQAIKKISDLGLFPTEVIEQDLSKKLTFFQQLRQRRKIAQQDLINFTRQLSNLLDSGLNILPSLNILKSQLALASFVAVIDDVAEKVKQGASFSEGLIKHENIFSSLYINVVRSGELSGKLNNALDTLSDFLEKKEDLRQRIIAALVYPAIVLLVGIITVAILLIFVIPRIGRMYEDMGQVLPIPTQIVILISNTIAHYFWFLFAAIVFLIFAINRRIKTKEGRDYFDRLKFKIPLLSIFVEKQHIVQFCRTLSLLLASGIPIVSALELTADILTNQIFKADVAKIAKAIRGGNSLSASIKLAQHFPVQVTNIITVAEESGTLEPSLNRIANSFERELDRIIKAFTTTLEPVLILLVGLVVAFIVISMLLPIFQINLIVG
ncbi:MAG: type II secretion system F family protein [Candidatus Omnitrophota bacterium]